MSAVEHAVGTQDRQAGVRILRLIPQYLALGYLVYSILLFPTILASRTYMATWWTVICAVLTLGAGILMGPLSWRGDARRLRMIAAIPMAGYLFALATFGFAWNGVPFDIPRGLWLVHFPGLAVLAAGLALRPAAAYAVLIVVGVGVGTISHLTRLEDLRSSVISSIAWGIGFSLIFLSAEVMAIRAAHTLDATRAQAYETAAVTAASQARSAERDRFNALTHDTVMATLLLAARRDQSPDLARSADAALAAIDEAGGYVPSRQITVPVALNHIRAAVAIVDPTVPVTVRVDDENATCPEFAITSMAGATAEALRNVQRHAGADVDVTVTVITDGDGCRVQVHDNGIGFDPSEVPPSRFGIAASIIGRMQRVDGGAAHVASERGRGTTVDIVWTRTAVPADVRR
ncbi:sensor histidine kinase [Gordonia sp. NPDC003504]